MKWPKCQTDNPNDSRFWKECGINIISAEESQPPYTKTLITPNHCLQEGNTVGRRYTIIAELGRGAMGIANKTKYAKIKRAVALKFLLSELTHIFEQIKNGGHI
jgi:hypothetical protein